MGWFLLVVGLTLFFIFRAQRKKPAYVSEPVPQFERYRPGSPIPAWNEYFPSLANATPEQRGFYRYWESHLKRGTPVDVEGNLSYIFVYLYSVVSDFVSTRNLASLERRFQQINECYSTYEKVVNYLVYWLEDALICVGNYDRAWTVAKTGWGAGKGHGLRLTDFINFHSKCQNHSIDGEDLLRWLGSDTGLTQFGLNHKETITELLTNYLDDFYKTHGENLIEHFCGRYDFEELGESDFEELKDYFPEKDHGLFQRSRHSDEDRNRKGSPWQYGHGLFGGCPSSGAVQVTCIAIPEVIRFALHYRAKRLFRECENQLREKMRLPRIGEGWVAETELYYEVKKLFPHLEVVQHASPAWLEKQHLDVFIPKAGIAIEYQGRQHFAPVDYFGGEDSYTRMVQRDAHKRNLCRRHGVKLFEVNEAFDWSQLASQLQEELSKRIHSNE